VERRRCFSVARCSAGSDAHSAARFAPLLENLACGSSSPYTSGWLFRLLLKRDEGRGKKPAKAVRDAVGEGVQGEELQARGKALVRHRFGCPSGTRTCNRAVKQDPLEAVFLLCPAQ
jgi:hypothetical protein